MQWRRRDWYCGSLIAAHSCPLRSILGRSCDSERDGGVMDEGLAVCIVLTVLCPAYKFRLLPFPLFLFSPHFRP